MEAPTMYNPLSFTLVPTPFTTLLTSEPVHGVLLLNPWTKCHWVLCYMYIVFKCGTSRCWT